MVSLQRQKKTKAASLLLASCLMFACAGISFAVPMSGKLMTRGSKPIVVNGNQASSGSTIFSGALIQSLEGIGATVELGALGQLDMAPNSEVMLTFSAGRVMAELKSGCVVLTTKKGIKGFVKTSEEQLETDSSKLSSINAPTDCVAGIKASAAGEAVGNRDGGMGAGGGGGIGAGTAVGIGAAGAAVIGGIVKARSSGRGSAVSSATPNR